MFKNFIQKVMNRKLIFTCLFLFGVLFGGRAWGQIFHWSCDDLTGGAYTDHDGIWPFIPVSLPLYGGVPFDCGAVIENTGGAFGAAAGGDGYLKVDAHAGLYRKINCDVPGERAFFYGDFSSAETPLDGHDNDNLLHFTAETWQRFDNLRGRVLIELDQRFSFRIEESGITLIARYSTPVCGADPFCNYVVLFNNQGPLNPCYYLDEAEWHHFVIRYDYSADNQFAVFVDGIYLPFSVNPGHHFEHLGNPPGSPSGFPTGEKVLRFGKRDDIGFLSTTGCGSADLPRVDVDECLFYNVALCDVAIHQHFVKVSTGSTIPFSNATTPGCGDCTECALDLPPLTLNPLDYPVGYPLAPCSGLAICTPPSGTTYYHRTLIPEFGYARQCTTLVPGTCSSCPWVPRQCVDGVEQLCLDDAVAGDGIYTIPFEPPPPPSTLMDPLIADVDPFLEQLEEYPLPRYVKNIPIRKLMPFLAITTLGSDHPPLSPNNAGARAMRELSRHYNFGYQVTSGFAGPGTSWAGGDPEMALLNYWNNGLSLAERQTIPLVARINWVGARPDAGVNFANVQRHNLISPTEPNYSYRSCSGNWINVNGKLCTTPFPDTEITNTTDNRLNSINLAGSDTTYHFADGQSISSALGIYENSSNYGRPMDYVIENGEVQEWIPMLSDDAPNCITTALCPFSCMACPNTDNRISALYPVGLHSIENWRIWQSQRNYLIRRAYNAGVRHPFPDRRMIWYNVGGNYRSTWKYAESAPIHLGIPEPGTFPAAPSITERRYPTPYFYPNGAASWRRTIGDLNGFETMELIVTDQISAGDPFFSPFVSPGYDNGHCSSRRIMDVDIMRPGPYLGVLKGLSLLGAEYFNVFHDNNNAFPYLNHNRWSGWQTVAPALVQGITSRYWDLFNNSVIVTGAYGSSSGIWAGPYRLSTECPSDYLYARRGNRSVGIANTAIFVVGGFTGGIENSDLPTARELIEDENDVTTSLERADHTRFNLSFNIRKQGSIYYFDNTFPTAPVFYQLDGWHEGIYYSRWSRDFVFEAEVFDENHTATAGALVNFEIETEDPDAPMPHTRIVLVSDLYDFTDFTSYITLDESIADGCWADPATAPSVSYFFTPRAQRLSAPITTSRQFAVWVKARTQTGQSGFFPAITNMDATVVTVENFPGVCVSSDDFMWYQVELGSGYTADTNQEHRLTLTAWSSGLEIDSVYLDDLGDGDIFNPAALALGPDCPAPWDFPPTVCAGAVVTFTPEPDSWVSCITFGWDFRDLLPPTPIMSIPGDAIVTHTYPLAASQHITVTDPTVGIFSHGGPFEMFITTGPLTASVTDGGVLNRVCHGASDVLTVTPDNPAYTYQWTFPDASVHIGNPMTIPGDISLGTATYHLDMFLTSDPSCSVPVDYIMVHSPIPVATITPDPFTYCAGTAFDLDVVGFTSATWTEPATGFAFSGLPLTLTLTTGSHTYSVVATNINGCSATDVITVTPRVTPGIISTPPGPVCFPSSVILTAVPDLSTCPACFYSWSPGGSGDAITYSGTGPVTLIVTDAGCSGPVTIASPILSPAPITVSPPPGTIFCEGAPVTFSISSSVGIFPGEMYHWTIRNVLTSADCDRDTPGPTFDPVAELCFALTPAVYEVSVWFVDVNGCTTSVGSTNIQVVADPVVTIDPIPVPFCNGMAHNIIANCATCTSFTWTLDGLPTITPTGVFYVGPTITPGTHTLSVTGTAPGFCTSAIVTTIFSVSPAPIVTLTSSSGSIPACPGTLVTLAATSSLPVATYIWDPAGSTSSINTVSSAGIYAVTVVSTSGCSGAAGISVPFFTVPVLTIAPTTLPPFCEGTGITFIATTTPPASGSTMYEWILDDTPIATTSINTVTIPSPSVGVVHKIKVKIDVPGIPCSVTSDLYVFDVSPAPVILSVTPSSPSPLCNDYSGYTLFADCPLCSSFLWTVDTDPAITGSATFTPGPLGTGTHTISVSGVSADLCLGDPVSTIVEVLPPLTLSVLPDAPTVIVCGGGPGILEATLDPPVVTPVTYLWSPCLSVPPCTTSTLTVTSSGTYSVTATDGEGCTATESRDVLISPALSADISGSGFICVSPYQLQNNFLTAVPTGGMGPFSFSWTGGSSDVKLTISSAGTYSVTITDAVGCSATATHTVTVANNCCTSVCATPELSENKSVLNDFNPFACSSLVFGSILTFPSSTNFVPDPTCAPTFPPISGNGSITVATQTTAAGFLPVTIIQGHTNSTSTDQFLLGVINTNSTGGSAPRAISEVVSVNEGQLYNFKAWVSNPNPVTTPPKKPTFIFKVMNNSTGVITTLFTTPAIDFATSTSMWHQYCTQWTPPTTGAYTFFICAQQKQAWFAIDDIVIEKAAPDISFMTPYCPTLTPILAGPLVPSSATYLTPAAWYQLPSSTVIASPTVAPYSYNTPAALQTYRFRISTSLLCGGYADVTVGSSCPPKTILSTPSGEASMSIFPNPSDGIFNLHGELDDAATIQLKLTATSGEVLTQKEYFREAGEFEIPIDIAALTDGVYHLEVLIGGEQWFFKLVKQE
jgi:hypothetical protein